MTPINPHRLSPAELEAIREGTFVLTGARHRLLAHIAALDSDICKLANRAAGDVEYDGMMTHSAQCWQSHFSCAKRRVVELEAERDEARKWAEETVAKVVAERVVTCVYCGHKYEDGTPESQDERLTAHIKVCEKHPMRELEATLKAEREQHREAIRELQKEMSEAVRGAAAEARWNYSEEGY